MNKLKSNRKCNQLNPNSKKNLHYFSNITISPLQMPLSTCSSLQSFDIFVTKEINCHKSPISPYSTLHRPNTNPHRQDAYLHRQNSNHDRQNAKFHRQNANPGRQNANLHRQNSNLDRQEANFHRHDTNLHRIISLPAGKNDNFC